MAQSPKITVDFTLCTHHFVCEETPLRQTFKIDGKQVTGVEWNRRQAKAQKRIESLTARLVEAVEAESLTLINALKSSLKPEEKKVYAELFEVAKLLQDVGDVGEDGSEAARLTLDNSIFVDNLEVHLLSNTLLALSANIKEAHL